MYTAVREGNIELLDELLDLRGADINMEWVSWELQLSISVYFYFLHSPQFFWMFQNTKWSLWDMVTIQSFKNRVFGLINLKLKIHHSLRGATCTRQGKFPTVKAISNPMLQSRNRNESLLWFPTTKIFYLFLMYLVVLFSSLMKIYSWPP